MVYREKLWVFVIAISLLVGLASINLQLGIAEAEDVTANLNGIGGTKGGVGFVVMEAMAKIVKKVYPGINMNIVAGGWVENLPRLNKGEADTVSTTVAMCGLAEAKKFPFEQPMPNLRSMYVTQDQLFFYAIVRKDLPVDSVGEIIKKKQPVKLGTLKPGNAAELCWRTTFESQGVSWDNIKAWGGEIFFGAWAELVTKVKNGELDGILAVGARKIGWAEELCAAKDMKILKWDKELIAVVEQKLGVGRGVIPMGTYKGIDYNVIAPLDTGEILVSINVPEKVVYAIVKAIAENATDYSKEHVLLADFKAEKMAQGLKLALHPGAARYYKEKGYIK